MNIACHILLLQGCKRCAGYLGYIVVLGDMCCILRPAEERRAELHVFANPELSRESFIAFLLFVKLMFSILGVNEHSVF